MTHEHHRHDAEPRWTKPLKALGRVAHVFATAIGAALTAAASVGGNPPLPPPEPGAGQRRDDYRP